MTTVSQSTKRKLSLLQLAEELGNVSKACKIMGYHRDTFYEVQKAFKVGGVSALVEGNRPRSTVLSPSFGDAYALISSVSSPCSIAVATAASSRSRTSARDSSGRRRSIARALWGPLATATWPTGCR
nr:helix-turn-helix domain-containing protein [Aquisalimonas sp.]